MYTALVTSLGCHVCGQPQRNQKWGLGMLGMDRLLGARSAAPESPWPRSAAAGPDRGALADAVARRHYALAYRATVEAVYARPASPPPRIDEAPAEHPGGGRLASRLPAVLDQIELIGLDPSIGIPAQTDRPATLHGLDAFYRGAALHAHRAVIQFVTWARRLLNGAPAPAVPTDSH
jgi:hypothetical protein